MDGVLIDSEPIYKDADRLFFQKLGWNIKEDDFLTIAGCSGMLIAEKIKENVPDIQYELSELSQMYDENTTETLKKNVDIRLEEGVEFWLKEFRRRGFKLAVGSSNTYEMVHCILDRFNITKYFDAVITSSDVEFTKPHPDIYNECSRQLAEKPENCLVIEDSINGLKAAKLAGMSCAAYIATCIYPMDISEFDMVIESYSADELNKIITQCQVNR